MRVLVCGGRNFEDRTLVQGILDGIERTEGIDCIITGQATGADTFAMEWAFEKTKAYCGFPADWNLGKRGGPIRNKLMLTEGRPDIVVAFPGGKGTANMVALAAAAGVRIIEINDEK